MSAGGARARMWDEALAMIERAESLHRRFFDPTLSPVQAPSWEPPIDIFETERELWIVATLPGVEPSDLDVSIESDVLRIAGRRRLQPGARSAVIHRLETPYGRFERRIHLPLNELALARSELVNGCLYVTLTKQR
jgi:HSP20 family protein